MMWGPIEYITLWIGIVTTLYVVLTYLMFRETKKGNDLTKQQLLQLSSPNLISQVFPLSAGFALKISNQGKSSANNLRLSLDKEIPLGVKGDNTPLINDLPPFQDVIGSFPPGHSVYIPLGKESVLFGNDARRNKETLVFKIKYEYEYATTMVSGEMNVDLLHISGTLRPPLPLEAEVSRVANEIHNIGKSKRSR